MKYRNLTLAVAVALSAATAQGHEIRLCVFPHSPTRAVDTAVAHAVFEHLGLRYRVVDLGAALGHGALPQASLVHLLGGKCDVFAGVPMSDDATPPATLLSSRPYAAADFVEFGMPGVAASGTVAVAYRTPAQLIAADAKVPNFDVENTPEAVIDAVVNHRATRGIAWYPSLLAYEQEHSGTRFTVAPVHSRLSHWDLRFVAAPRQRVLLGRVSRSLDAMHHSGALQRLTAPLAPHAEAAQTASASAPNPAQGGKAAAQAPAGPTAQFAAEQVGPGRQVYAAECAKCHGAKLEGRTAPALMGPGFAPASNSTMTIGGIYQYMETNMPDDKTGKLSPEQYSDVMAYLLHSNGYTASGKMLTTKTAEGDQSQFDSFVK